LVLDSLRGLAMGGIDLMGSTAYLQTEAFSVIADGEVPLQVDGEWVGRFSEVKFLETPNELRVFAPEEPLVNGFSDTMKSLLSWPRRAVAEPQVARTP
jgi:diacylglycerol kinase family enzyme